MTRTKIDYGIDLGTTNSSIAYIEKGEPKIKKSDTLKEVMPSCVSYNKKQSIQVGDSAWNTLKSDKLRAMRKWENFNYNTFIEFKRTMGTNETYYSSHMDKAFNSEELSAEVLKKLKSFIDEDFRAVVVTVPAKFDIRQNDATKRASKLAGFKQCELLLEPIAASMAYGLDSKSKNGYWIVFDFGGGTFDAALVKVEESVMKIIDSDGDNYLGGKNLDMAIVEQIILPYLQQEYVIDSILKDDNKKEILQEAMKYYAEEAKIQLSFKEEHNILSDLGDIPGEDDEGEEFELDITLTRDELKKVIAPIFQRAINTTKEVLQRNNLTGEKLDTIILVGGPTHSPILREMLEEQIKKPDTSVDPMTAVANGAALYASTADVTVEIQESGRDKTKVQLDIGHESTSVETEEWVTIKTLPYKTEGRIPEKIFADIIRSDKAWSSGKTEINDKGEIIEVKLEEGKPNEFEVKVYDEYGNQVPAEPDRFTIIQGIGGIDSAATLPHQIGIELDTGKPFSVFWPIQGLEKNVTLPAKGIINGLKTKKDIRPGNKNDQIKIALYQGEYNSKNSRAIHNKLIYNVVITGDDLPAMLPENSDVDLTIATDKSGRIEKLEAFFPYLEYTSEIAIPDKPPESIEAEILANELNKADKTINRLKSNPLIDRNKIEKLKQELEYQHNNFEQGKNRTDRRNEVFSNLKKLLREADEIEEQIEWPKLEKELRKEFERLEKANNELGDEKSTSQVEELKKELDEVIRKQDEQIGKDLLERVRQLYVSITFIYQLIALVRSYDENFESTKWKDRSQAKHQLEKAKEIIADNPTTEKLHPVVVNIIKLLYQDEVTEVGIEILRKGDK